MPATAARVGFVTQEFRYDVQENAAVKTTYPLAREIEMESFFGSASDAASINADAVSLVGYARAVLEVDVAGIMPLDASQTTPVVTLYSDRFGLGLGKQFLVTSITWDRARDVTTLRLWG